MTIVHRRPNLSDAGPARPAPQKAPPVKKETTIPLRLVNSMLGRWVHSMRLDLTFYSEKDC